MQRFTGLHKKSTAGIVCALGIFFISSFAYSNAIEASVSQRDAISSAELPAPTKNTLETNAVETNTVETNTIEANTIETNNGAAQTPVIANSSAAALKQNLPSQTTSSASQLASLMGGLVLILLLIYGLSWFVKRFNQGGFMQNPSMKIVSAMPLGTRERLMLVDIGGKQLLLGVTATQINTLHVFDEPVVAIQKPQPVASDFSQKLMAILQQKNTVSPNDTLHKNSNP